MALLCLNLDVFREITSYLPQGSRTSLMRTCRALYSSPEAAKIVLGGYIVLRSSKKVASFVAYLNAEKKPRCQYVRELWLHPPNFSRRDLLAFSLCVPNFSSLTSLQLHEVDLMLSTCPELGEAIAKLPSLRDLDLSGVGAATCIMVQALECALVSISLWWLIRIDEDIDEEFLLSHENHAVQRLANLTSTLESLSCSNWYTGRDLPDFPTVYPNMRELSIDRDDFPHMKPYMRAYPHLTRLEVQTDHASDLRCDNDPTDTVEELREHRDINIAEQSGQPWVWQELGEFVGCAADLFLIGLTCPINRVRLHETASVEVTFDMFREVLAMARPKELKVDGYGGLLLDPIHGLIPVLKNPDTRLEHLVAEVYLGKDHREADIAEALVGLLSHSYLLGILILLPAGGTAPGVVDASAPSSPIIPPRPWPRPHTLRSLVHGSHDGEEERRAHASISPRPRR